MRSEELRDSTLALQHFYEIDGVERREAVGTIYRATAQPFGRAVSVCVLEQLTEMGVDEAIVDRFEQAIRQASRLCAPAHARPIDVGKLDADTPFVVFEPVSGDTLRQHLQRHGAMSTWQMLRVVEQLAAVVKEAHHNGLHGLGLDADRVIVRDVQRAVVRVYGLGIAFSRQELIDLDDAIVSQALIRHLPPSAFKSAAPRDDTIPDAMPAPGSDDANEDCTTAARQPSAAQQGVAADIYGLAAIAYEVLCGVHPYFREDRDVGDGVLAILREAPLELAAHYGVPASIAAVIAPALGTDPSRVYPSVSAFVAALRAATPDEDKATADQAARLEWLGENVDLPQAARPVRAPRFPLRGLRTAALWMALLLVCGAAFWGYRASGDSVILAAEIPDFVPPAAPGEGVDVVLTAGVISDDPASLAVRPADVELYMVSSRGDTDYVAQTPFVVRNQREGARLRFVMRGDGLQVHQFDVVVRDAGGQTMFVNERMISERVERRAQLD